MSFLRDYVFYNSGNECPESFHLWSGLSILSCVAGQRLVLDMEYFDVFANIYICLVGDSGGGKSIARKLAKTVLVKNFPHLPMSASVQSAEDLAMKVAENMVCIKKPDGTLHEYHPYCIFVNELESFLRVDARKMIALLVDMYDSELYDTGFKRDTKAEGNDKIPNPCLTMLACATPKWMMDNLKIDLFSGGLGRRLIIVYEQKVKAIAWPKIPKGGVEAYERCVKHLKTMATLGGTFTPSPEAREWYTHWYEVERPKKKPTDPILSIFYSTKHIQMLKVAMLLSLDEQPFDLILRPEKMQLALGMLDLLEPTIPRLTAGAGKNPLALPTAELLEIIASYGGAMTRTKAQRVLFPNMMQYQIDDVLRHLETTEQIKILADKRGVSWIVLKDRYEKIKAEFAIVGTNGQPISDSTSHPPAEVPPVKPAPVAGVDPKATLVGMPQRPSVPSAVIRPAVPTALPPSVAAPTTPPAAAGDKDVQSH